MKKNSQKYQKYSQALVENSGVCVADAHEEIAEWTVDVLTAALKIFKITIKCQISIILYHLTTAAL